MVGPALDRGARERAARGLGATRAGSNLRARRPNARPRCQGWQGHCQGHGLASHAVQDHHRAHRSSAGLLGRRPSTDWRRRRSSRPSFWPVRCRRRSTRSSSRRARACSPSSASDLETSCSCPDWGDPCKHVAATHYVLGEALDGDPFCSSSCEEEPRIEVIDALRAARGGVSGATAKKGGKSKRTPQDVSIEVPTVMLGKLRAATTTSRASHCRPCTSASTIPSPTAPCYGSLVRRPLGRVMRVRPMCSRPSCARPQRQHAASRWPSRATPASLRGRHRRAAAPLESAPLNPGALTETGPGSRARS